MMRMIVPGSGSWTFREAAVPVPGAGQVLVQVRAAALNRADLDELAGRYRPRDRGAGTEAAGSELAGTVAALGPGTAGAGVGDRVMAMVEAAFAEYAAVDSRLLLPVPDGLSDADAAALPSALMTEYDALFLQGGLAPGSTVLITAATSGTGLLAAALARRAGATVLGSTTRADRMPYLAERGVSPVPGRPGALSASVRAATGGRGADLVIDHVGGALLDDAVAATRIGGTLVHLGRLGGTRGELDLDRLAYRRVRLVGSTFRTRDDTERAAIAAAVRSRALDWVADGSVRAPIAALVPFAEAPRALDLLRRPEAPGKVVLSPFPRADPSSR